MFVAVVQSAWIVLFMSLIILYLFFSESKNYFLLFLFFFVLLWNKGNFFKMIFPKKYWQARSINGTEQMHILPAPYFADPLLKDRQRRGWLARQHGHFCLLFAQCQYAAYLLLPACFANGQQQFDY